MKFAVTLVTVDVYQNTPLSNVVINSNITGDISIPLKYDELKKCYTGAILHPEQICSQSFKTVRQCKVTCLDGVFMEKCKYLKTLSYITSTKKAIRTARLAQQDVIIQMEIELNKLRHELRKRDKKPDWRLATQNIALIPNNPNNTVNGNAY
jgi:hypothetical protein